MAKFEFKEYPQLKDHHSFMSPSKYHWLRYSREKLLDAFDKHMDSALGTRWHKFADEAIKLGFEAPNNTKTINLYINACIGHRMNTEMVLFYSEFCFGSADAINFDPETGILRIFDLKMGKTKVSGEQLIVYAALFCLNYNIKPQLIEYDLRIYQNDDVHQIETSFIEIEQAIEVIKENDLILRTERPEMVWR